jgi:hypothetical protein
VMHIVQAKDVVHVEKHKGASVMPHIVVLSMYVASYLVTRY